MIGAIICAGVLMVFCAVCLIIVLTLRAHDRGARQDREGCRVTASAVDHRP